jgi:hypothetical protein
MRIRCLTLFDITKTGIGRRQAATIEDTVKYNKARSQQINFETVLQIISMRCQPEQITDPQKTEIIPTEQYWGYLYCNAKQKIPQWEFRFVVEQKEVFFNGIHELGNLYSDADGVPMIIKLEEWDKLSTQINISTELKNIHFEVIEND